MTCSCCDPNCPAHKGTSDCHKKEEISLQRIDMDPSTMAFCFECAMDALDSGVFAIAGIEDEGE